MASVRRWGIRAALVAWLAVSIGALPLPVTAVAVRSSFHVKPCPAHRSHVIAAAGKGRIFRLGAEYYACRQGGHRIDIGASAYGGQTSRALNHFRLNRRFVAWAVNQFSDSYGNSDFYIEVASVLTGRHVTEVPTGNVPGYTNPLPGDRGVGPTKALVLGKDGSVAWIAMRNLEGPPFYEVWRHDARGTTELDAGGNIDPTSLRLRGHRIEWARAGHVTTSDIR